MGAGIRNTRRIVMKKGINAEERFVSFYLKTHQYDTWWGAVCRYEFLKKLHSGYYDQPEDLDSFRLDYSDRF